MSLWSKLAETIRSAGASSLDERRRDARVDCEFEAVCREQERELPGLILDLSQTGMRVRLPGTLPVGTQVRVSCTPAGVMHGRQRLLCRVAWTRALEIGGAEIGLVIVDTEDNVAHSWVRPVLRQLGFNRTLTVRRHRRFETASTVAVRTHKDLGHAVMVDLSLGGAQLELDQPLALGCLVTIEVPQDELGSGLRLMGKVVASRRPRGEFFHRLSVRFFQPNNAQAKALRGRLQKLAA